ncbi:MAG: LUD domain-containing protein [Anaerolineales bacterium]
MTVASVDIKNSLNQNFAKLADEKRIQQVTDALEANGMKVLIAETGEEAKKLVLDLVPQGVEIYTNQSKTIDVLGLRAEFDESGRYNAVRPKVMAMDRKTQSDEIRKLRSNPDYILESVQAITEVGKY